HKRELMPLTADQRSEYATQRLRLARARGTGDHRPRSATQRREPLDRLQRRVLGIEREPLVGLGDWKRLVAGPLGPLVGRGGVDRVPSNQRRVTLRAPGRTARAAHAV